MSRTFFPANIQMQQVIVKPANSKDMNQVKPYDGNYHVLMNNVENWQHAVLKFAIENNLPLKVSKKAFSNKTMFYTICGDNYADALATARSIDNLANVSDEDVPTTPVSTVDTLCFTIENGELVITKRKVSKYTKQYLLTEAKVSNPTIISPTLHTYIEIIALLDVGIEEGFTDVNKLSHMAAVTKAGKLLLVNRGWKRFTL